MPEDYDPGPVFRAMGSATLQQQIVAVGEALREKRGVQIRVPEDSIEEISRSIDTLGLRERLLRALPGAREVLELVRANMHMCVGTNGDHPIFKDNLRYLGLLDYFIDAATGKEHLYCVSDVKPGRGKPEPDIFLKAMRKSGIENVQPSEVLVVGNAIQDLEAARAAGMDCVINTACEKNPDPQFWLDRGAKLTVGNLYELAEWLAGRQGWDYRAERNPAAFHELRR